MKKSIVALVLAALPLSAAGASTVEAFLQKATALEKKGPLALLSGDFKMLKGEIQTSSQQLRAERVNAARAGRKPAYCPPEKGGLSSSDILAHFRSIPPADRARMQVKDGLRSLLAKKYPCRA